MSLLFDVDAFEKRLEDNPTFRDCIGDDDPPPMPAQAMSTHQVTTRLIRYLFSEAKYRADTFDALAKLCGVSVEVITRIVVSENRLFAYDICSLDSQVWLNGAGLAIALILSKHLPKNCEFRSFHDFGESIAVTWFDPDTGNHRYSSFYRGKLIEEKPAPLPNPWLIALNAVMHIIGNCADNPDESTKTCENVSITFEPVIETKSSGCGGLNTYLCKGSNNKYWRYSYRVNGNLKHLHIKGGNERSPLVKARVATLSSHIEAGWDNQAIVKLIKSW